MVLNFTINTIANIILTPTYLASLVFTLMSWVSKLERLNKSVQPSEAFALAKRFHEMFNGLEKGMGRLLFLWIFVSQITWITFIFLAISMAADGLSDAYDVVNFLSYFVGAIATLLRATSFIFCLSECHASLEVLGNTLADDILEMEPGRERQEAKLLIKVGVRDHGLSKISVSRRLRGWDPWLAWVCSG